MSTYPGMTLRGEVRESISLDEDDPSDVEDEVFIRDGKRGYKFAEELGVKRPLMAPRRKTTRPDLTTRLKNKPSCSTFCKPCCYIFAALSILIGLITLVVILTSLFPLPLDKLRDWIVSKTNLKPKPLKMLPCSKLTVTDIWSVKLPKLTSESPIRTLDANQDDVKDIIFGFGTGDNANILQDGVFCPIYMGIAPPCEGGVIALNGRNGSILWRRWMNDSIFSISCNADINRDGTNDCLIIGKKGNMAVLNSKTGYPIWETTGRLDDIFLANFIPDQDNDTFADVLSSHSKYNGNIGHLILLSGKTGNELKRKEIDQTYFMPQIFKRNNEWFVVYGTGGPVTGGSLHLSPLSFITSGNLTSAILYSDSYKGMLTQILLVDITGDKQVDIIAAIYNSTIVALDGLTLQQIWNYTVPNSETLFVPTPAYFNDDNVTDFMVVYQTPNPINGNSTTQAYILDGKSGKPIYEKPFLGVIENQVGGLSLRMSGYGNDMFVFWSKEALCYPVNNVTNTTDYLNKKCYGSSNITFMFKLNAMNQYDQPPGFELYNSEKQKLFEVNDTKSALEEAIEFLREHPEHITNIGNQDKHNAEMYERPLQTKLTYKTRPNSRKTYNTKGLDLPYATNERDKFTEGQGEPNIYEDYNQGREDINTLVEEAIDPADLDYNTYDDSGAYNQNRKTFVDDSQNYKLNSRDPRSKEDKNEFPEYFDAFAPEQPPEPVKDTHFNAALSNDFKNGIYDYKNVRNSKTRLLHDLNNLPTDILRETYFKNQENQFKKSRFEQRDLQSHENKDNEKLIKGIEELRSINGSLNLWVLESEKELEDKKNEYVRGKRSSSDGDAVFNRIISTGALTKSSDDTIDIFFFTYWTGRKRTSEQILDEHMQKCVNDKISAHQAKLYENTEKKEIEEHAAIFVKECEDEYKAYKKDMPYYSQILSLRLSQMVVYKIRIKCTCEILKNSENCAKFLPVESEGWASYLGR